MLWLQRLLYGRYGVDKLSIALLVLGMVSAMVSRLTGVVWWGLPFYICVVWGCYRILSKDIYKRNQENLKFLGAVGRVRKFFALRYRMAREWRTHKYLRCPKCRQRLRVPRGRGKIMVTCAKCHESFTKKV